MKRGSQCYLLCHLVYNQDCLTLVCSASAIAGGGSDTGRRLFVYEHIEYISGLVGGGGGGTNGGICNLELAATVLAAAWVQCW